MRKICHITSVHTRYDVRIFRKQCTTLAQEGYEVVLLVNDDMKDEVLNEVKIISIRKSSSSRFKRLLSSNKVLMKRALQIDADIYQFHDPELLFLANKLSNKKRKVIFDFHEDVPAQILEKQWIPSLFRKMISSAYQLFESYSIKKYDAVISVTPHIVDRLSDFNRNVKMITNYPIVDDLEIITRNPSKSICFAGGISNQWNHETILKAMEGIDVEYNLAGRMSEEYGDKLKEYASWEKVNYYGVIPHSEVKRIYEKSAIGMALNYTLQARDIGTLGNTKLFEYMSAKIPVICTDYVLWKEIVDEHNCGIYVNPFDAEAVKNAIQYLLENESEAAMMGNNGRVAAVSKFNWKSQGDLLVDLYERLYE